MIFEFEPVVLCLGIALQNIILFQGVLNFCEILRAFSEIGASLDISATFAVSILRSHHLIADLADGDLIYACIQLIDV